jgi:peptidoglycan/xylan/chitin deacetylase (PgdA/CDA1 family)
MSVDAAPAPWTRRVLLGVSIGWVFLVTPWLIASLPGAVGLLPQIAIHLLLLYAVLRPNNGLLGPVVTRFEPSAPGAREVWLTIDDGPDRDDNPRLLALLDAAGARATFFLRGDRARSCPEAVREIVRRGHTLGNHTDTHLSRWFWGLGPRGLAREIDAAAATLTALSDARQDASVHRLFRPPVGMQNIFLWPLLRSRGLQLIGWSARGFDGVSRHRASATVARILRDLQPGAIVLLHEGVRGRDGEPLNVIGLQLLLGALRERGYATVIPRDEQLL